MWIGRQHQLSLLVLTTLMHKLISIITAHDYFIGPIWHCTITVLNQILSSILNRLRKGALRMRIILLMLRLLLLLRRILSLERYSLNATSRNCTKLKLLSLLYLLKVNLTARRAFLEEIRRRVRLQILHRIFPAIRILTRMHSWIFAREGNSKCIIVGLVWNSIQLLNKR